MSRLPDKIETDGLEDWEGRRRTKFNEEFVSELVEKYNELIDYLSEVAPPQEAQE